VDLVHHVLVDESVNRESWRARKRNLFRPREQVLRHWLGLRAAGRENGFSGLRWKDGAGGRGDLENLLMLVKAGAEGGAGMFGWRETRCLAPASDIRGGKRGQNCWRRARAAGRLLTRPRGSGDEWKILASGSLRGRQFRLRFFAYSRGSWLRMKRSLFERVTDRSAFPRIKPRSTARNPLWAKGERPARKAGGPLQELKRRR